MFRQLDQALNAGLRSGHVEMIADHVQEGLTRNKVTRTINGVTVAPRVQLRDEAHSAAEVASGLGVASFVARPDDNTNFVDIRGLDLFD
jgi:hypothetical protein